MTRPENSREAGKRITQEEWFGPALGSAILALVLAGYGVTGTAAPYLLLPLIVLAIPYTIAVHRELWSVPDTASRSFAAAFGLLAIAFALGGREAINVLSVINFIWLLFFLPLASLFKRLANPNAAIVLARLALLGVLLMLAMAAYERVILGAHRVGYLSSDAIRFANTAVILGFLALTGVLADTGLRRLVYIAGPLCALAVALLAATRGALLCSGVLAVIAVILVVRNRRWAIAIALGVVAAAVAIIALGWQFRIARIHLLVRSVLELLQGAEISNSSANIRYGMLQAAWGAFLERPVFGHSWQNMMTVIRPHLPLGLQDLPHWHRHLHNDLADFAVSAGLVGILSYAIILATPVAAAWRSSRDALYRPRLFAATMLALSYLFLGMNALMFGFELHTALYIALAAIILGYCREVGSRDGKSASIKYDGSM